MTQSTNFRVIRGHHLYILSKANAWADTGDSIHDLAFKRFIFKACYSLGRSTGANLLRNKWWLIFALTFETMNQAKRAEWADHMIELSKEHARHYSLGLPRFRFMMNLVKLGIAAQANQRGITNGTIVFLIRDFHALFEDADNDHRTNSRQANLLWLAGFADSYQMRIQECGHYEIFSHARTFRGNASTYQWQQSVCQQCAAEAQMSDNDATRRMEDNNRQLIIASFGVVVHSNHGSTYVADRRAYGLRTITRRGVEIIVDEYYTPYGDLLQSYHSSRNRGFRRIESPWLNSHRRAFGLELEVQLRSGNLNKKLAEVHEALNHETTELGEYCFFERDGSIGEGFEIVTQPAGIDTHRERLSRFLESDAIKRGLRSHEGGACGLHVHVGREYLTQAQIYRVQSFLNNRANEELVRKIARRYDNGYCRYHGHLAKLSPMGKHSTERYEALNVTNNETVEFRIFRGSLRFESVMAALEFCNALLTFCTPGEVAFSDFHSDGFKNFVMNSRQKEDTKFLRRYLNLGGLNETTDNETAAEAA